MVPVNYFAVLVAAIVAIVLGILWYGVLFGKQWMELLGATPDQLQKAREKGKSKEYTIQAFAALVMSYMLQHAVVFTSAYLSLSGVAAGVFVGVGAWMGFAAPVTLGMVLWEGKSWKYGGIVSGYYLATFIVMATILSVWR